MTIQITLYCPGCQSTNVVKKRMLVRGMGIRDIAQVEQISIGKVLNFLRQLKIAPQPKESHYDEPPWPG